MDSDENGRCTGGRGNCVLDECTQAPMVRGIISTTRSISTKCRMHERRLRGADEVWWSGKPSIASERKVEARVNAEASGRIGFS